MTVEIARLEEARESKAPWKKWAGLDFHQSEYIIPPAKKLNSARHNPDQRLRVGIRSARAAARRPAS